MSPKTNEGDPVSPDYWQNPELDTGRDGLPDSWKGSTAWIHSSPRASMAAPEIRTETASRTSPNTPSRFHPKNTNTNGTADATKDRDGDGMKDWQEAATLQWKWDQTQSKFTFTKVLDWQLPDANGDVDKDGLTNRSTPADHWDTDGDLLPDDWKSPTASIQTCPPAATVAMAIWTTTA